MSLKWKEIAVLLEEARPLLVGSSLQKIAQLRQANGESFLLQGFGPAGPWRLWVCLLQDHSCWVMAPDEWETESQPEPSAFVMVLRKRIQGKRILGIEQIRGERFLFLHFEGNLSLLCELYPKRANLMLLEDWNRDTRAGRYLQGFRQVSLETGGIYRLPPPPAQGLSAAAQECREFASGREGIAPFHQGVGEKYWKGVQQTGFGSYQRLWRQLWKSHSKKLRTALANSKADLDESREAELFQQRGMALVSHLYELGPKQLPREKSVLLDGVEITLDPQKTYSENAEACFRKAKKFTRAVQELEGRVRELESKLAAAEIVSRKIDSASDEETLEKLLPELEREGLEAPQRPEETVREEEEPEARPFLEIRSSDGFQILCGRNQEENRRVTFREAKGNDLWVHVKGLPGAHVVIREQRNKSVPLSTLLEAAQLCLYHSKIRKGKRAEVDYTRRKNVKALKGTTAEVTYTGNKTLYVEADPEALRKLMRS